jgi:hypothetical protein
MDFFIDVGREHRMMYERRAIAPIHENDEEVYVKVWQSKNYRQNRWNLRSLLLHRFMGIYR